MGCGNPPALTAMEEGLNELCLTTKPSGADDFGRTHGGDSLGDNIMSFPYAHFPWDDIQVDCRSYQSECQTENSSQGSYVNLNCLTDSRTGANLTNTESDMFVFPRESETSYPEVSMRELGQATDGSSTVAADCFTNTAVSSMDYQKSEIHMNFMPPRCETAPGYPLKAHGAEAKSSRINRSQMSRNFSPSEHSTSVLPLVDNFGVTGNKNDIDIVPVPFGSPQKVDGNFLTLGIGSGREIRSSGNFSTREIASKLEEAVSSECNSSLHGKSLQNPLRITQLTGRAARVQTDASRLLSSASNLASRMSTCEESGLIGETSNSIPFPGLQALQDNRRSNFLANYDSSLFDLTPPALPYESTLISQPKCITPTPSGTAKTGTTYLGSQSVYQQQDYCRKNFMNIPSESSRNYLSDRHRGGSINHAQLGQLIPVTEGRGTQSSSGVHFPVSVQTRGSLTLPAEGTRTEVATFGSSPSSVQSVGRLHTSSDVGSVEALGNSLFPQGIRFQVPKGSTSRSAAAGLFPKRLGVQPNDFATARTAKAPPPFRSPPQINPFRPSVFSGQHQHDMPAQFSKDFPRKDYSNGQDNPVAKLDLRRQASIVSHPSLKRQATEHSPTAHLGQRRKIIPQPSLHRPAPHHMQTIPATPATIPTAVHIPPTPHHIKWQGFDGPPEPTGHRCQLCKRDLSFTAEGPVYQPAIPPAVAVLHCGHTFHDHCLQIITPEDQAKSPPCIPCAVGET